MDRPNASLSIGGIVLQCTRRAVGGRQSEGELRVASAGSSVASRDAAEREPLASPSIVQPPRLAAGVAVARVNLEERSGAPQRTVRGRSG